MDYIAREAEEWLEAFRLEAQELGENPTTREVRGFLGALEVVALSLSDARKAEARVHESERSAPLAV